MRGSAAVLLLLSVVGSGACSGGGSPGQAHYQTQGCVACHGATGRGSSLAPPLAGLAEHWTREDLADYLAGPRAWVERTPRLRDLGSRYSQEMPAVGLPEEQRLELADYVLELSTRLSE